MKAQATAQLERSLRVRLSAVPCFFECGFSGASGALGAALNSYNIPSPEAEGVHSLRLAISGDGKGDKDER